MVERLADHPQHTGARAPSKEALSIHVGSILRAEESNAGLDDGGERERRLGAHEVFQGSAKLL